MSHSQDAALKLSAAQPGVLSGHWSCPPVPCAASVPPGPQAAPPAGRSDIRWDMLVAVAPSLPTPVLQLTYQVSQLISRIWVFGKLSEYPRRAGDGLCTEGS